MEVNMVIRAGKYLCAVPKSREWGLDREKMRRIQEILESSASVEEANDLVISYLRAIGIKDACRGNVIVIRSSQQ